MIAYLLQLTIVWGVLYTFYYLFLRKLTFFAANRFFLLASLVMGLWLPTLDIDWAYWLPLSENSATPTYLPTIPVDWQQLDRPAASAEAVITPSALPSSSSPLPDWPWYYYAYLLGAALAVIRLVAGLWQMQRLYLEGKRHYASDYVRIDHEAVPTPFSFFRYIFWSPRLDHRTTDGQRILQHERAHGRLGHSWDIVLIETLQILGWFHPLLFLYRRSLQQIHEYQADAAVLRETAVRTYGTMLLRQAQGKGQPAFLAHPFSNTQLKNRILMMTRTRSRYHQLWRFALAVPLLLLLMVCFSNAGLSQEALDAGTDPIYTAEDLESTALFPGATTFQETDSALFRFIGKQIRYPQAAIDQEIKGTNVVAFTIQKDGAVTDIEVIRDVGGGTGAEVLRVMKTMPNWIPAKVNGKPVETRYRYPIRFHLQQGEDGPEGVTVREDLILDEKFLELKAASAKKMAQEDLFMVVEDMPLFPGTTTREESIDAVLRHITRNITYPARARKSKIQGTNVVQFVVRKDGSIDDVMLLRDVGAGTGEEAIRVVETLPDGWTPGKQRGRTVDVLYRIPIKFRLPEGTDGYGHIIVDDGAQHESALFSDASTFEETESLLMSFFGTRMRYPRKAIDEELEGLAFLKFTVKKDGSVDDIDVTRDIGAGSKEEILRVAKAMPRWSPAKLHGKAVDSRFVYPILFKLQPGENGPRGILVFDNLRLDQNLTEQTQASAKNPLADEEVFMLVEDMPLFPGTNTKEESDKAVFDHVARNIKYPKVARETGVTGTNVVQFIVRKDGSISDIEVIRNIGAGTGEESIRVVESMPDGWKPGKQRGREVNVQFRLPIRFKATDEHVSQIAIDEPQKEPVPEPKAVDTQEPKEQIFKKVDEMPLFAGSSSKGESEKALFEFIQQNLRYPEVAKKNGVEGVVVAQFIIRKDGSVSDVTLLRDLGAGAGEEAMRVIRDMPKWVPGKQKGNPVNVQFRIPVRFKLAEEVATPPQEINVNQINNTLSDDALTIFPNPSDGRVELRFKEPLAAGDVIRLYNANGQFLRTESLGNQVGSVSRAMTIAQPGTYYLQLVKGTKVLTKTVIIQ
jgi:TonB family protein